MCKNYVIGFLVDKIPHKEETEETEAEVQLTEKEQKAIEQREYDIEALRQANSNVERTINQVVRSFPKLQTNQLKL